MVAITVDAYQLIMTQAHGRLALCNAFVDTPDTKGPHIPQVVRDTHHNVLLLTALQHVVDWISIVGVVYICHLDVAMPLL